jgi:hypothetical protein
MTPLLGRQDVARKRYGRTATFGWAPGPSPVEGTTRTGTLDRQPPASIRRAARSAIAARPPSRSRWCWADDPGRREVYASVDRGARGHIEDRRAVQPRQSGRHSNFALVRRLVQQTQR